MPLKIRDYLKEKLGIDMDAQNISNYKSLLKAEHKKAATRQPASKASSTAGFSLEEIQAVKEVADRIGAGRVRQLAEVFGR